MKPVYIPEQKIQSKEWVAAGGSSPKNKKDVSKYPNGYGSRFLEF